MQKVKHRVYRNEKRDSDYVEFDAQPTPEQYAEVGGVGEVELIPGPTPTRDEVFNAISEAHSRIYRELWSERNYESAWEVLMYANLTGHRYQPEAQALIDWRVTTWDTIETANITAETDADAFIESLPKFEFA